MVLIGRHPGSTPFKSSAASDVYKGQCGLRVAELGACIGLGSDAGAYRVFHGQGLLDEYAYMRQAVPDEKALEDMLREAEKRIRSLF